MLDVDCFHLNYSYFRRSVFAYCSAFLMRSLFTFQICLKSMDIKSKQSLLNGIIAKGF